MSLPFPQIHSLGFDKKIFFGPLSLEIDWQSTTLFFLHYSPCERRERVVRLWYEKVDKHPLFSYKTCYSWCQRFYSMKIVLFRLFFFFLSFAKKINKLGLKNCFLVWVDILFLNQWNANLREWMNLLRSQSVFLDILDEKKKFTIGF